MDVIEDDDPPPFAPPWSSISYDARDGQDYALHARVEIQPPRQAQEGVALTRPVIISLECPRVTHYQSVASIFLTDEFGTRIEKDGSGPLGPTRGLKKVFKVPDPNAFAQPWVEVSLSVVHPEATIAYAAFQGLKFRREGSYRIGVAITQYHKIMDADGNESYYYINGRVATSKIDVHYSYIPPREIRGTYFIDCSLSLSHSLTLSLSLS